MKPGLPPALRTWHSWNLVLTWTKMPGFARGYAVTGFVLAQGPRTKPGGADRDRTDDLLNAIRSLVIDHDPRSASAIDYVNPEIS
jgi:hypothetical protein